MYVPVGRGSDGNSLSTNAEREDLRRVNPRSGAPGWRVRSDKEVCASNDSLCRCTSDLPRLFGDATETAFRSWVAVSCHEPGVGEHPGHHKDGANNKHRAATPTVHEEKSRNGHQDVDDVLNGTGDEVDVAGKTCHSEDVCDVVHHDVHTR